MFDHNIKDIGLYTRPSTQGDELDLVEDFIEYYIHNFLKSNKTNNLAIFVEPKVASGFPDIVFASYSPKILENWSEQRENLETNDLKVLSQLLMTKGSTGVIVSVFCKTSSAFIEPSLNGFFPVIHS